MLVEALLWQAQEKERNFRFFSCSSHVLKHLYYTDFMLVQIQISLSDMMFFKAFSARMNLELILTLALH